MNRYRNTFLAAILIGILAIGCRKEFAEPPCETPVSGTPYVFPTMPFFPEMDIPENNPLTQEKVELGRHLFWEKALSGNNTMSCGTCHLPTNNFSDPAQFSTGINGEIGNRQAMALVNLGWANDFFWDGRALTLEDQVIQPVTNPIEMAQEWPEALEELAAIDIYPPMFEAAFGSPEITQTRAAKAMASFLRTMVSYQSKFDLSRIGMAQLSESEQRGLDLFQREGGDPLYGADCFHCHGFGAMQFSDYLPRNNGLDSIFTDLGYGGISGDPLLMGKFKTPSLRNVELSAPYMHDGRFNTLEEVIEHYNSGGLPSPTIDPFMKYTDGGLTLTDMDKEDLVNFLKTLTDTAYVNNPAYQDPFN
ncbi:MAG: c-type cytochrome [Flavobacteriales bacterium]|nr:c-type cytochrome [Flavobacteriales bacterium]